MSVIYTQAGRDVVDFVNKVWADKFPLLWDVEPRPTLSILMATKEGGPPLKHHGWPAMAIIAVTSPEDRACGAADLLLKIDEIRWLLLGPMAKEALVAHELMHVQLTTFAAESGVGVVVDDQGRPRIKIRPHDWEVGGFTEIVDWYGDDAIEKRSVDSINETLSQQVFQFREGHPAKKAASKA